MTKISQKRNLDIAPYLAGSKICPRYFHIQHLRDFGWSVGLGLMALLDSISVYIGPFPKERDKQEAQ